MKMARRSFGRMVLGLPHNAQDYAAVGVAAELAECLGVECLGAFIVEPGMAALGTLPGAQELRSVAAGWQPIDRENLLRDIEVAAAAARRRFNDVTGRRGIDTPFRLARGATSEIVASLVGRDDIVAMIEPSHPADRITRQFKDLIEAAFQTSSSVMLLPSRVARKQGPIVAVAAGPGDAAIEIAADFAGATGESLVVVSAVDQPIDAAAIAAGRPVRPRVIPMPWSGMSVEERIAAGLAGVRERLIVARRATLEGGKPRALADKRGIPVLVTGGGK